MVLQCFIILISVCLYGTAENATTTELTTITFEESANETEVANATRISECNDFEWRCGDGRCIPNDTVCDGIVNCKDASDEYRHMCNSTVRPLFGLILHCASFWGNNHNELCPQVCHNKNTREFCYYALLAENGGKDPDLCIMPEFPENGFYKVHPNNDTESGPKKFSLEYQCDEPYVIVQTKLHECKNGTWINDDDNRYCSEACQLNINSNFTYTCPVNVYDETDCGKYIAINTNVTVTRAPTEDLNDDELIKNISVELTCSNEKEFNISTDCVDAVDKRQQEFENPTMAKMTQYETEFNKFRSNETNEDFKQMVEEFRVFEIEVRNELNDLRIMAEKCDMSLDLLLWDLQIKKQQEGAVNTV